jgi:hypothetical protein
MKTDLRYFQQSTSSFLDRGTRRLISRYKANGYLIYQYLKCEIFRDYGYYIFYDEFLAEDIVNSFSFLNKNEVEETIMYCLEIDLFDKNLFEKSRVLTSKSIQENYQDISKRMKRKIQLNEYSLLENLGHKTHNEDIEDNELKTENYSTISHDKSIDSENDKEFFPKIQETFKNNYGKFAPTSGKFQPTCGEVGSTSEMFEKTSRKFAGKEIKEIKERKERNKEVYLSLEREKIVEIFLTEKNYPFDEVEKFLNHYSKTGWKDKNGNEIIDPYAAAKNWTQLNSPYKYFIKPESHKSWVQIWSRYKECVGFENAKYLLNIKPLMDSKTIIFFCEERDKDICEANIDNLKIILREVLGKNIQLEYRVQ